MSDRDSRPSFVAFLFIKLGIFTIVVPGSVTVWIPLYWLFPWLRRAITAESLVAGFGFGADFDWGLGIFLVRAGFCVSREGDACAD